MNAFFVLLKTDLVRFFREKLLVVFSIIMLVLYSAVSFFVPEDIQPRWGFAVDSAEGKALVDEMFARDKRATFPVIVLSPEELEAAFKAEKSEVLEDKLDRFDASLFAGFSFEPDYRAKVARGASPRVRIFVDETAGKTTQETARSVGELIALSAIAPPSGDDERVEKVLGPKVPERSFKDRLRALMALMILVMELLAVGSLLSREVGSGAVQSILATTVSLSKYWLAKISFGALVALAQALLVTAATGGLSDNPLLITLHLVLGALLVTGFGVIAGTRSKHLMEVMLIGALFMLPCLAPAVFAMLPGAPPLIARVLPTSALFEGLLSAGDTAPLTPHFVTLGIAAAWTAGVLVVSFIALKLRTRA